MMACKVGGGWRAVVRACVGFWGPRRRGGRCLVGGVGAGVVRCRRSPLARWGEGAHCCCRTPGAMALAHRAHEGGSCSYLWGRPQLVCWPVSSALSPAPTLLTASLPLAVSDGPAAGARCCRRGAVLTCRPAPNLTARNRWPATPRIAVGELARPSVVRSIRSAACPSLPDHPAHMGQARGTCGGGPSPACLPGALR